MMVQASCGASVPTRSGRSGTAPGVTAGAGNGATAPAATAGVDSGAWGLGAPHVANRAEPRVTCGGDSAD